MIIDSHQHFWNYHPSMNAWISEEMKVLRKDFLASDLKAVLDKNQIDGCIAVQADQSEDETSFLLDLAAKNKFIKGVVGWVDLRAENLKDRLSFFTKDKNFKGVRHILQAEPDGFMIDKGFLNGIKQLQAFDLTYDILIHQKQLEEAKEFVAHFEHQKFILDHLAKPQIEGKINQNWIKNIKALAKHENVSCKISGMVTETKDFQWKKEDFTTYLDTIVDAFGVDRILFGSDWPVCLVAAKYHEVMEIVKEYFKHFSATEKSKIFGLNASKTYKI